MRDSVPNFAKRRKIAAITCIAALVILVMHSRCTSSIPEETSVTMTEKSAGVVNRDTETSDDPDADAEPISAAADVAGTDTETLRAPIAAVKPVERVLIMGADRSGGIPGRTDGMMVAVFDYAANRVGVISIPRDLYVEIPGLEPGRINTVLRAGTRALGREKGLALVKSVVRQTLGISIDYTAAADFEGFIAAVDALGGVTVDVQCPIEDCFWTGGETCEPLSLEAGSHHIDGKTALLFARSRHGRTDLDRGRRQQALLMGLKRRLIRPTTVFALPRLIDKLRQYVDTDLPLDAVVRMGALLRNAGPERIHGLILKSPIVESAVTPDKKSVLVLNGPLWQRALSNLYKSSPPGRRVRGTCPAADVGLHWRERKQKFEQKHLAASAGVTEN